MPSQAIVDGLKGIIDFYLWRGKVVARRWPYWKSRDPSPAEKQAQMVFSYVNKMWAQLPPYVKAQYTMMAQGTTSTAKDFFVRAFISGARHRV